MFELEDELARLRDRLEDAGIEYALCGGLALGIHGHPRATVDIDILILPGDEERVEAIARELGFRDSLDGDRLALDVMLVTPATAEIWGSRQRVAWRDRDLRVVSAEGLVSLKTLRSSKQDIADIERVQPVDMSPHAVTTRLRRVSQLRRLCLSLAKAKPIDAPSDQPPPDVPTAPPVLS